MGHEQVAGSVMGHEQVPGSVMGHERNQSMSVGQSRGASSAVTGIDTHTHHVLCFGHVEETHNPHWGAVALDRKWRTTALQRAEYTAWTVFATMQVRQLTVLCVAAMSATCTIYVSACGRRQLAEGLAGLLCLLKRVCMQLAVRGVRQVPGILVSRCMRARPWQAIIKQAAADAAHVASVFDVSKCIPYCELVWGA